MRLYMNCCNIQSSLNATAVVAILQSLTAYTRVFAVQKQGVREAWATINQTNVLQTVAVVSRAGEEQSFL